MKGKNKCNVSIRGQERIRKVGKNVKKGQRLSQITFLKTVTFKNVLFTLKYTVRATVSLSMFCEREYSCFIITFHALKESNLKDNNLIIFVELFNAIPRPK